MFPPVIIRVNKDGAPHDEAHVDGSATVPFFVPPAFVQTPPGAHDGTNHTAVYVIIRRIAGRSATSDTIDHSGNSVVEHSCWVEPHVANNA
jgi:hypothetical protein